MVLVLLIVAVFMYYVSDYRNKLYNQNLNDITNINNAAANIASEFFYSQETKLADVKQYLTLHPMEMNDLIEFIDDSNAGDSVNFELIGSNYCGYVLSKNEDGGYEEVKYDSSSYDDLHVIFDGAAENGGIGFSGEFTDQHTTARSFARYIYLPISKDGEISFYTLMAVSKTSDFVDMMSVGKGYQSLSTVLINSNGEYILRNTSFKSSTFFHYLYLYNNLNLDNIKELQEQMHLSGGGHLVYKNSLGEECVFVYISVPDTDWCAVTCVPVSSFHSTSFDITFTVLLLSILVVIMVIDFIWLTELNKKLKASADEAQAANIAKTEFLSRMSHDIRTPINVISGMAELAADEKDRSQLDEYLCNIKSSSKFLLGLVNDILDMNKVESGKMELHPKPYSYAELSRYINAIIGPLCKAKNITFNMKTNLENFAIIVDSLRLNQIFFNILSNAVKFTPDDGEIDFISDIQIVGENQASAYFTIKDNGIGMSKEFQAKMFDVFSQETKAETSNIVGSGLGLAIVKNLTELMNGTITVESEEHKGTTFVLHLDLGIAKIENGDEEKETAIDVMKGVKVLLCEDHPLNAQIISRLLSKVGASVERAENGKIGVEMFDSSQEGYFSAILMDIRMPIMDGLEAAKAIRDLPRLDAKVVPIIALSANAYEEDVQQSLNAGMNTHLAKPIEPKSLYDTLAKYVAIYQDSKK